MEQRDVKIEDQDLQPSTSATSMSFKSEKEWLEENTPSTRTSTSGVSTETLSSCGPAASMTSAPPAREKRKVHRACAQCKGSHTACDDERPCGRCVSLGMAEQCHDAECKKRGRPKKPKRTRPSPIINLVPSTIFGAASHHPFVAAGLPSLGRLPSPPPLSANGSNTAFGMKMPTTMNTSTNLNDTNFNRNNNMTNSSGSSGFNEGSMVSLFSTLLAEIKELKESNKELKKLQETTNDLKQTANELKAGQQILKQQLLSLISGMQQIQQQLSSQQHVPVVGGSFAADASYVQPQGSFPQHQMNSSLPRTQHSRQPPHAQPQSFSADGGMRSMPYAGLNGNALIDRSLNPFVVRDPNKPFLIMIKRKGGFNGVLHAVNRAFCRLFNYEVDEIIGSSWQRLVSAGEAQRVLKILMPLLQNSNSGFSPIVTIHPRCITKDGATFKAVTHHQYFYDTKGNPIWSAITVDSLLFEDEDNNIQQTDVLDVLNGIIPFSVFLNNPSPLNSPSYLGVQVSTILTSQNNQHTSNNMSYNLNSKPNTSSVYNSASYPSSSPSSSSSTSSSPIMPQTASFPPEHQASFGVNHHMQPPHQYNQTQQHMTGNHGSYGINNNTHTGPKPSMYTNIVPNTMYPNNITIGTASNNSSYSQTSTQQQQQQHSTSINFNTSNENMQHVNSGKANSGQMNHISGTNSNLGNQRYQSNLGGGSNANTNTSSSSNTLPRNNPYHVAPPTSFNTMEMNELKRDNVNVHHRHHQHQVVEGDVNMDLNSNISGGAPPESTGGVMPQPQPQPQQQQQQQQGGYSWLAGMPPQSPPPPFANSPRFTFYDEHDELHDDTLS